MKSNFSKLIDNLLDKGYSWMEIHQFLEIRLIFAIGYHVLFPTSNFHKRVDEALIEVDFLKHK